MDRDPALLEQEAYSFLSQERFEEAFRLFRRAAQIHKTQDNHKQSALCFASAASCWSKKSGERSFYNAASAYEAAAKESQKSGDFEYASVLYKYAALNHERDGEFFNFSECIYRSKESYRKFLTQCIFMPGRVCRISAAKEYRGAQGLLRGFFSWLILTASFIIWGHGERPSKAFSSAIFVILVSAFFYTFGNLLKNNVVFKPTIFESLYFSVVTFTTVGYGDIVPQGAAKLLAVIESFSGVFIMPLFIIALSRKYLRV
jgi:tetratricopeptide (TPR) repeat protein